jgi:hypothetical protein
MHRTLSIRLPSGLPTEVRLFRAGENPTEKGMFLFDSEAAAAVMANWRERNVDLSFDFAHAMVEPGVSPQDQIAAGWASLELRGGDLWAVNIRWTPRAASQLSAGEWRYVSPAFSVDEESRRILKVHNVGLTNIPATHGAQELIAASTHTRTARAHLPAAEKHELDVRMGLAAAPPPRSLSTRRYIGAGTAPAAPSPRRLSPMGDKVTTPQEGPTVRRVGNRLVFRP